MYTHTHTHTHIYIYIYTHTHTHSGTIILAQSGPHSNGNERIIHIAQSSRTEASSSDAVQCHIQDTHWGRGGGLRDAVGIFYSFSHVLVL